MIDGDAFGELAGTQVERDEGLDLGRDGGGGGREQQRADGDGGKERTEAHGGSSSVGREAVTLQPRDASDNAPGGSPLPHPKEAGLLIPGLVS